jgi:hypothetical protein
MPCRSKHHRQLISEDFDLVMGQVCDLVGAFLRLQGVVEKAHHDARDGIKMAVKSANDAFDYGIH